MEMVRFAAVGIVAAVLAITVKKTNPEISLQVSLAAGIVILLMSLEYLRETVGFIRDFAESMGSGYESVQLVLKVIGIAYLCEFAVQALKDAGENAIGMKVELGGKLLMILLTMPLFTRFVSLVMQLAEEL